jgi:NAD(P)-dependent dehydrogenase (short-subunit alcohol dehydrogenase family)
MSKDFCTSQGYNSANDQKENQDHIATWSTGQEVYQAEVYCASKHAVDALNQGMRIDLNHFGLCRGDHPVW